MQERVLADDRNAEEGKPSPLPLQMAAIPEAQREEIGGDDIEERKGPIGMGDPNAEVGGGEAEADADADDGDGVDSGRFILSNEEYNMSDVEEDKNYIEEVKRGIEYETDGSQESDIPEEHENGYGFNEYIRRYILNMKLMTWNRDSQGLFDYETRHCQKLKLTTDKTCRMVRRNQACKIHSFDENLEREYGKRGQVLFNVKKIRNHYMIEPSEIERLKTMTAEEKKEFMSKDVD